MYVDPDGSFILISCIFYKDCSICVMLCFVDAMHVCIFTGLYPGGRWSWWLYPGHPYGAERTGRHNEWTNIIWNQPRRMLYILSWRQAFKFGIYINLYIYILGTFRSLRIIAGWPLTDGNIPVCVHDLSGHPTVRHAAKGAYCHRRCRW